MFCLYTNLYMFLLRLNYYNFSFFLINNFNIITFLYSKKLNVVIKNNKKLLLTPKNYNNNLFVLKTYKFFSNFSFRKTDIFNNQNTDSYTFNNVNLTFFNKKNFTFFKKFNNAIIDLSFNSYKFLILDTSYKSIIPLYNYIYGLNTLHSYKFFFFFNYKYFSYCDQQNLFIHFSRAFNVAMIIVLNFNIFKKFFLSLKKLNLPIATIIDFNTVNVVADYPIFINNNARMVDRFIILNTLYYFYFLADNLKNYNLKIEYLKIFYKFYISSLK